MVTFTDGPAVRATLALGRAPIYLRVVVDETDGKVDALDQLDDTPGPSERVHVYRRRRYGGVIFACARGHRKGDDHACSGQYVIAEYEHLEGIDGEQLRETDAWREWAHSQPEARPKAEAIG